MHKPATQRQLHPRIVCASVRSKSRCEEVLLALLSCPSWEWLHLTGHALKPASCYFPFHCAHSVVRAAGFLVAVPPLCIEEQPGQTKANARRFIVWKPLPSNAPLIISRHASEELLIFLLNFWNISCLPIPCCYTHNHTTPYSAPPENNCYSSGTNLFFRAPVMSRPIIWL